MNKFINEKELYTADAVKPVEMKASDIAMLKSIYCYGSFCGSYYEAIVAKYGQKATEAMAREIEAKYSVVVGTYTDHEGCTYNSLVERETV